MVARFRRWAAIKMALKNGRCVIQNNNYKVVRGGRLPPGKCAMIRTQRIGGKTFFCPERRCPHWCWLAFGKTAKDDPWRNSTLFGAFSEAMQEIISSGAEGDVVQVSLPTEPNSEVLHTFSAMKDKTFSMEADVANLNWLVGFVYKDQDMSNTKKTPKGQEREKGKSECEDADEKGDVCLPLVMQLEVGKENDNESVDSLCDKSTRPRKMGQDTTIIWMYSCGNAETCRRPYVIPKSIPSDSQVSSSLPQVSAAWSLCECRVLFSFCIVFVSSHNAFFQIKHQSIVCPGESHSNSAAKSAQVSFESTQVGTKSAQVSLGSVPVSVQSWSRLDPTSADLGLTGAGLVSSLVDLKLTWADLALTWAT